MPDQPVQPVGYYDDDTIATWLAPETPQFNLRRAPMAGPLRTNPTMYYATAFWTADGFSVKQGVTVNTLVAGP